MKKRYWNLPSWKIFRCVRCKKNPRFIYKTSRYRIGKICTLCSLKALDSLFVEAGEKPFFLPFVENAISSENKQTLNERS